MLKKHAAAIALALWVFMPLIRRLVQWPASYSTGNALTLIPPIFALGLYFVLRPQVKIPKLVEFAVVCTLFGFLYALILAIAMGNYMASFYTFIDFIAPLLLATVVAAPSEDVEERYDAYLKAVGIVTLIVSIYGIAQYLSPSPWDAKWMIDSRLRSIGHPKPFLVRVFSVLNGPGVLGAYLGVAMLHLLPLARRAPILAGSTLILGSITLLLSMLRAGWVAALGGLAVYLIFSEQRMTLMKALLTVIVALVVSTTLLQNAPGFAKPMATLGQRLDTLGDVEHDHSAIDRENQMRVGLAMAAQNPIGYGLGIFGMATSLNSYDGTNQLIDHGFLARLLELGLPGFAGYMAPFLAGAGLCFMTLLDSFQPRKTESRYTDHLALAAATLTSLMLLNCFGDFDRGVTSYIGWTAIFFFAALQYKHRNERCTQRCITV
jgi:hypothetical protein